MVALTRSRWSLRDHVTCGHGTVFVLVYDDGCWQRNPDNAVVLVSGQAGV